MISASRTFTYTDESAPTFLDVPAQAVLSGGADLPTAAPTALDYCDGTASPVTVAELAPRRIDAPNTSRYEVIRTWTAIDLCRNTATATQRVVMREIPVLSRSLEATPTTCGDDDGAVTIFFDDDLHRTGIQFALNGVWKPSLPSDQGPLPTPSSPPAPTPSAAAGATAIVPTS